ncbi:MAG: hypothetical protein KKH57_03075, partial [Candidatus Omnitrophica bacterium]|nr:hypothetical protein [Candidatus Omnitrophota bacterium]
MLSFRKVHYLKIISITIGIFLLSSPKVYPTSIIKNSLRVPIGQKAIHKRISKEMNRREFIKKIGALGGAIVLTHGSLIDMAVAEPTKEVQQIISKMSLREKLGFLMMPSIDPTFNQQDIDYISNYYKLRAYLYDTFYHIDYNGAVIERIFKTQAKFYSQKLPPLIAINMEGGWISLIPDAPFPSPMALGAAGSYKLAEVNGSMIGRTLAQLGINVNLAPVLDLYSNQENRIVSTRSFGEDPEKVAALGAAFIKGLQSQGIFATAKHFPGIGGAEGDPHIAMQRLDKNLVQLENEELIPFKAAIAAGVKIIMTGHLLVPQIDPKNPASLSKVFTTDILRHRLGFKGVVMVDDVRMQAITNKSKGTGLSVEEATIRAIE